MFRCFTTAAALLAFSSPDGLTQGLAAAETSELTLVNSAIGLGPDADGTPIEVRTFYQGERVRFYTKLRFDSTHGSAGAHRLLYKWYTGDEITQSFSVEKQFDVSPTDWWAYIEAAHFKPGHHRAELLIDNQLFANGEFDIKGTARPHEPEEDIAIKDAALALLLAGDIRQFDQLALRYAASQERTTSGTWKLSLLYNAVDEHSFAPADQRWKELHETSDAWLARNPDSPVAVSLKARILFAHAWAWRGDDSGGPAPEPNRENYRQLIEHARTVLDQHADVALQDPEWDTLRISIARQQGAGTDEILAMAERALRRWPSFYALHNAAVNALLPRWHGSREAIQAYTDLALDHSRSEGTQAYARIYYYIARTAADPLDELNQMAGKLPRFLQSMEEILQRYPSRFNQDIARNMAYLGGDAVAYRRYGRAATDAVLPVAPWDTAKWRRWANEWAFEGKHGTRPSPLRRIRAYFSFLRGEGPEFWNPLRWMILVALVLIEGGCRFFDWWWRRPTRDGDFSQSTMIAFNPLHYPRAYYLMPLGRTSLRVGLWMLVFSTAAAYALLQIPWPDPQETRLVVAGLITIAALGAFLVLNVATSRLILRANELQWRSIVGSRTVRRNDMLGVRRLTDEPALEVVLRNERATPFVVPAVLREDDAFRLWFESLPRLAEAASDDSDDSDDS